MTCHCAKNISYQLWILIALVGLNIFFHLFGFGGYIGLSYKSGQYGNQWVLFWGVAFGLIIDFQACYMLRKRVMNAPAQKKIIWSVYCGWMFIMAVMLIVGDSIVGERGEITGHNGVLAVWGATWMVSLFVIVTATWLKSLQQTSVERKPSENHVAPLRVSDKLPPIYPMSSMGKARQAEAEGEGGSVTEQVVPLPKKRPCCCRRCCTLKCTVKGVAWSSIGFLSVFGFLLALQVVWSANDVLNYGPLGQRIKVQISSRMEVPTRATLLGEGTLNMHILCKGPTGAGSTFIFEAGGGSFSASFFALQDRLVTAGRRSCIYDRAGYGWSDVLIVPTNSFQPVLHLHELLRTIGEPAPYILVGHSVGGQLIQLYAALFPSQVSGLAMLDSVPDFIYPLSLTTKPMNSIVTFAELQPYLTFIKPIIDLYRVASPFGMHRWLQTASSDYQPTNRKNYYNAGYGKSLNWHAQYFDYLGSPHMIEILDSFSSQKYLNGFGWPTLVNVGTPVLGIIANSTAGGPGPLCSSSTDDSCTPQARVGRAYYDGARLQTITLSNNATFTVCDAPCSHSFVWTDKVDWVAERILAKFAGV